METGLVSHQEPNITERTDRDAAIIQLASLVESAGDAISGNTLAGVITSWNSSAEHLYGYDADEVLGTSLSLLVPPDRQEELSKIVERIKLGEAVQRFETVRVRKDGTLLEVSVMVSPIRDVEGRIVGASTIAHDITERKRMEGEVARRGDEREQIMHKLERITQHLHGLVEHTPAGLALFDARPPYQVLLHNTVLQEFFPEPFRSEGMLGKYLPEYVPRAEEDGVSEVFRQVVSTRQGVILFNFVYDGMPRGRTWWNWHLAPIITDGEVTALAQTVLETTQEVLARQQLDTELAERTRAEDALRQSRDELAASNTALEEANRARSEFLSTMSHELRTPLTSMIGFSQLLLDDAQEARWNQQHQHDLQRILKNGQHLLSLINDVLDLSKIEAGRMVLKYSQIDVRELLTSVVEEIQSMALAQHLVLRAEVEEGIDFLESHQLKLRQVLLNLVSNAIKFTEQGEVTVSATRVISSGQQADQIVFAVKDSGIGIAFDIQEHIFEAFYQVDGSYTRKFGGTGLGLSIVSQLTALLGGTIALTSAPGQGSTFTVMLPLKAVQHSMEQDLPRLHPVQQAEASTTSSSLDKLTPAAVDATNTQQAAADGQPNLVLAIDDNPDALVLIKAALKDTPYTIVGVQDPLHVMELVQELHPRAIILDVMMPNLNGWQLLHQLKDHPDTSSIPIVVLTVIEEPTTGYVLGADEYLIKPFKSDVLRNTLRHVIAARKAPSQASEREAQPV